MVLAKASVQDSDSLKGIFARATLDGLCKSLHLFLLHLIVDEMERLEDGVISRLILLVDSKIFLDRHFAPLEDDPVAFHLAQQTFSVFSVDQESFKVQILDGV